MRASTKGKDTSTLGEGEFKHPKPGKYHVSCNGIEVQPDKYPKNVVVDFEVLEGTVPGQKGLTTKAFLWYEPEHPKYGDSNYDRINRLFWALGLVGEDEERDVDEREAIGKQCIIELVEEVSKKTNKKVIALAETGLWPVGHKEVSDVPTNKTMIEYGEREAKQAAESERKAATAGANTDTLAGL